jgi:putative zinc finger/helix-turn-helix YgiT family protein
MDKKMENHRYEPVAGFVVTLAGMKVHRCPECGEEEVGIPNIEGLHRALADLVIRKRARLAPPEIRFLRKYLGLAGSDFAERIGVDSTTVSKWENGAQPMGTTADRLLRLMVAHGKPVAEYPIETLSDVAREEPKPSRIGVRHLNDGSWTAELAA